jgi:ribose transport system substrate-binding protein
VQETRPRTNARRKLARWSALLAVTALVAVACSNSAASSAPAATAAPATEAPATAAPATAAPATEAPATAAPADENPYFATGAVAGSGAGLKVGYISLGDSLPFVKLVSDSIAEQAKIAGLTFSPCDSQVDAAKSLECGQNLGVQGVQGVLNFNLFGDSSKAICDAYGGVPTIAIDIHQPPCEVTFFGANNKRAGEIGGAGLADVLKAENGCTYDMVITLETAAAGVVNTDRVAGMLDGFASVCGPIDAAKLNHLEVGGTTELGLAKMNDLLPTLKPGGIYVLLSLNDDMALGALAAARQANREGELRIGAQGADPSSWKEMACDSKIWLADSAYYPEAYGKTLVPAIIDILNGKTVAKELYTPHIAINKDNIRQIYPATPAC